MLLYKWHELFIKYPNACRFLYFWAIQRPYTPSFDIDINMLLTVLGDKKIIGNEEKVFNFFDEKIIYCGVFPIAHKTFKCFAQSEYRACFSNDMTNRDLCTSFIIYNGLDLLEERITENQKNV